MTGIHGHVTARPDGRKATCGGPACCQDCANELAARREPLKATDDAITIRLSFERADGSIQSICTDIPAAVLADTSVQDLWRDWLMPMAFEARRRTLNTDAER